ncbi:MAG: 50S ribosomal protein L9 [Chlamydiales bacterium]|nr:50S ribosomal protein L9 [Chlamydiales bacterium]MCH9635916.1 50S ribosomal protein L9 [Chlamydiales bacterium]MCH9703340.1 50S ribosomal protein L9 [Chlamydiota bacterium]
MRQQLLLLEDVDGLGRSGEVVTAKAGHVRNFLLPKGKALVADKHTLKMQAKLKEERSKQAEVDRKEAEAYALKLKEIVLEQEVKVDTEGKMYGSVTQMEIIKLLQDAGHELERRNLLLPHPIKTLGTHLVKLRLKEGVEAEVQMKVTAEGGAPVVVEEVVEATTQGE